MQIPTTPCFCGVCELVHLCGQMCCLFVVVVVTSHDFTGTGYCVDDGQMTWTDELQMMTSRQGHTSQSHK